MNQPSKIDPARTKVEDLLRAFIKISAPASIYLDLAEHLDDPAIAIFGILSRDTLDWLLKSLSFDSFAWEQYRHAADFASSEYSRTIIRALKQFEQSDDGEQYRQTAKQALDLFQTTERQRREIFVETDGWAIVAALLEMTARITR